MPEHNSPYLSPFPGLDLLSAAVILVNEDLTVRFANPAAENLLQSSVKSLCNRPLYEVMQASQGLREALENALRNNWGFTGHNVEIALEDRGKQQLDCTVTPVDSGEIRLVLELRPIDQQLKATREERLLEQQQANRELIRNLAHEIKNPLGGIRGAAQLLEHELGGLQGAPAYKEYTQVIIKEADRLQDLMQRLLSPNRPMHPAPVNIHEILERVRSLLKAEFPEHLQVQRDYDTSLPDLLGDREQLIQVFLNIARNAAQALEGKGEIILRSRAARQVTLAKRRYRLAMEIQVIDNGPGIPDSLRERIFYPLVSGREGGSGLGLTLVQNFVHLHKGSITCTSRQGHTCFTVLLPLELAGK